MGWTALSSRQIQIAHDKTDEKGLIAWLEAKADLRALPATSRNGDLRPTKLLGCEVARQVVFLAQDERRVVEAARPSREDPDLVVVASSAGCGWYFEWSRTRSDASSNYSPMGVEGSRVYFPKPYDGAASSKELRRVFDALIRWIRTTSPSISTDRYPIYVGRSLSERVARGEARVVTPNGKDIVLVPNPKCV